MLRLTTLIATIGLCLLLILVGISTRLGQQISTDVIAYRAHEDNHTALSIHDLTARLNHPVLVGINSFTSAPDRSWATFSTASAPDGTMRCGLYDLRGLHIITERTAPTCQIWQSPTQTAALIMTNADNRFTFEFLHADGTRYHRASMGQPLGLRPPSDTGSIAWSPDDRHVIFAYQTAGNNGLWAMHHIDTQRTGTDTVVAGNIRLIVNAMWDEGWNAAGDTFLFTGRRNQTNAWGLWHFQPGQPAQRIGDINGGIDGSPWHPAGQRFLRAESDHIALVDATTMQATRISREDISTVVLDIDVTWLGDTGWVQLVSTGGGVHHLDLYDTTTGTNHTLIRNGLIRPFTRFGGHSVGYVAEGTLHIFDLRSGKTYTEIALDHHSFEILPVAGEWTIIVVEQSINQYDVYVFGGPDDELIHHDAMLYTAPQVIPISPDDNALLSLGKLVPIAALTQPNPQAVQLDLVSDAINLVDLHPDGQRIIFTNKTTANTQDVYVLQTTTFDLQRITNTARDETHPIWLPR